jgi:hypothetical protein
MNTMQQRRHFGTSKIGDRFREKCVGSVASDGIHLIFLSIVCHPSCKLQYVRVNDQYNSNNNKKLLCIRHRNRSAIESNYAQIPVEKARNRRVACRTSHDVAIL